jgi:hypothetical protein
MFPLVVALENSVEAAAAAAVVAPESTRIITPGTEEKNNLSQTLNESDGRSHDSNDINSRKSPSNSFCYWTYIYIYSFLYFVSHFIY